jgi:prevent-host-death family protein
VKPIRVSEDVVPVGEFRAKTKQWLARAAKTGQPVVITQNGRPAGVLLSPGEFDRLTYRERFITDVEAGMADIEAGRVHDLDDVMEHLAKRRAARARRR